MKRELNLYSGLWAAAFVLLVTVLLIFRFDTSYYIPKLLNIQFSENLDTFIDLIKNKTTVIRNNTELDFFFILIYTLLFLFSAKIFEFSLQTRFNRYSYLLCIIPGIADLLENYLLLDMLDYQATGIKYKAYYWAVRFKWTVVIGFILMSLTILLYYGLVIWGKSYNLIWRLFERISKY